METEGETRSNSPSSMAATKKGYVCVPQKWRVYIYIVTTMYVLWFNFLEYVSLVMDKYNVERYKLEDIKHEKQAVSSVGELTPIARNNSLTRRDSREVLLGWLDNDPFEGSNSFEYESFGQALAMVTRGCARNGYIQFLASLVLRNEDICDPLAKLSRTFDEIKKKTEKTVKFRFLFKKLTSFLKDVERGKIEDMIQMIHFISEDVATRPCTWWMEFEHGFLRCDSAPRNVFETGLATMSLFFSWGANFDVHGLANVRDSPRRMHDSMLTLFMICAMERIGNSWESEINVTEFGGTERILKSEWKEGFTRHTSQKTKTSEAMFKDNAVWDVMLNECNEFVETSWSAAVMERGLWGLECGRQFVKRSDFDKLMGLVEQEDEVDLTEFDSRALLAFAICGVIRFHGNTGDAIFRMVELGDVQRVLKGQLPAVSIQDLVDLQIMEKVGKDRYMMKNIPGIDRKYKGSDVDGRISFTTHKYNTRFSALATQNIL